MVPGNLDGRVESRGGWIELAQLQFDALSNRAGAYARRVERLHDCQGGLDLGGVTFDFGARIGGYHSDLTRTVVLGAASDRQREVYQVVLDGQQAALSALRPGMTSK